MEELTIRQIKQKQRELKKELNDKLNKFYQETGMHVKGRIEFGFCTDKNKQFVLINFSNPFN